MSIEVSMPQLGESVAEGTLVKWHKRIGDRIDRDEILFEISTDKVDTEIPSPEEGYLEKILVPEGETVPVHTTVCVISKLPPAAGPSGESQRPAASAPPPQRFAAEPGGAAARPAPARPAAISSSPAAQTSRSEDRVLEMARERSSPLVRRLALEHQVDLSRVRGTGLGGRVTKEDILRHVAVRDRPAHAPELGAPPQVESPRPAAGPDAGAADVHAAEVRAAEVEPPPPSAFLSGFEAVPESPEDRVEPMPLMRQKIAEHMLLSRRTSAHVTTIFEIDMTPVRELRRFFGDPFEERFGARLTFLPFIIQAVARSLRKFPSLNACIEGRNVRYRGNVNIGIAVALDHGLIVPVIRQADQKDLPALAQAVQDLARRARTKDLSPEEVRDGTFTITNPGVFGSIVGTPIINQPQVAILCVGAVVKRPVVLPGTDAIAVRSMAYFSLTFDHRLIDGAMGDRFLGDIKSTLENASFEGLSSLK